MIAAASSRPARCVLLALLAPLALVIAAAAPGAWIAAPALGLALLVLVVGRRAAGRAAASTCGSIAPADVEVGEPRARLRLHADARRRPARRGRGRARARPAAAPHGTRDRGACAASRRGPGQADASAHPRTRRGTGHDRRVWLRWTGPLGLGARQARPRSSARCASGPNLVAGALADAAGLPARRAVRPGRAAHPRRGHEFEALSEYQPGMDRRRIDWKTRPATPGCSPARTRPSATTRSSSRSIAARRCASRSTGCRGSTARSPPRSPPPTSRSRAATGWRCSASPRGPR